MAPTGGKVVVAFLLISLFAAQTYGLNCLVVRPGYGLVSEKCSSEAVACRIRIDHHAIEFYEYSALYDRNQFVCVLKNEYGLVDKSGCVQKRSGRGVRCWCYGRSNCNSAENSKRLYEAFMSGDKELYEKTIVEIDQSENSDSLEIGGLPITSMPSSTETTTTTKLLSTRTTTSTPTTAIPRSTKSTHNKGGAIRLHEVTEKSRQSGVTIHSGSSIVLDESERASQDIPSMRYGRLHKNHEEGSTQVSLFSPASIEPVLSKSGSQHHEKDTNPHRLRQHEHKGATRVTTKTTTSPTKISTFPKSVVTVRPRTTTSSSTTERPTTSTTPLKTTVWPERASNDIVIPPDEPVDKKIHVIRVGPNDQYEHVIGSQEFSNIIQKEAMKALSTDSTASTTPENDLEYEDDAETFYEHDEQETKHPIHMVDVSRIQKSINSGEAEGPMNEYFDTGSLSHATRLSSTNLFELIFIFIFYLIIV